MTDSVALGCHSPICWAGEITIHTKRLTVLLYLARLAASQISMSREIREQKSFVERAVDEAKLTEQAIEILLRHREWRRVPQSAQTSP
jgi:hypothetical protein